LNLTRRAYLASVTFVDEQIGKILGALRETGALEDTFILFTSDHGDLQMDHYLWRKTFPYEGSAHVPLIVRWPGTMDAEVAIPRGSQLQAVTELRDIFPTFLDVGGNWSKDIEQDFDGRPLTWLLRGRGGTWRKWIDLEHGFFWHLPHWNALTDGETKYIFFASTGQEQLFNLTADREENKDLSLSPDPGVQALRQAWRARLAQHFDQEGRGPSWVRDGVMLRRGSPCRYGPHFPSDQSPLDDVPRARPVQTRLGAKRSAVVSRKPLRLRPALPTEPEPPR
jgi:arylsulfatase A-like enzyme